MTDPTSCLLCGRAASEHHHVIPRGHIVGKCSEDWPLNLAPLCKDCHAEMHALGCHYEVLWNRMEYSVLELMVLAALGAHSKATMYPLVRKRAQWAWERLTGEQRVDYIVSLSEWKTQADYRAAVERLTEARPIPGWI